MKLLKDWNLGRERRKHREQHAYQVYKVTLKVTDAFGRELAYSHTFKERTFLNGTTMQTGATEYDGHGAKAEFHIEKVKK